MVYSTRRFLHVFQCVILFLCFSVLLVLRLPRLGKRELILVLFVRLSGLCLFRFVGFLFLLASGKELRFVIMALPGLFSYLFLISPSEDTAILSMKGADLLVNEITLYSVLLNASLNWPISSSALLHSNSATKERKWRVGTPCVSFFDYLCICRSLWDLPLHHLPSYSHTNHAAF